MINALHLLWIIPTATMFGYFIAALMVAAKSGDKERREERYETVTVERTTDIKRDDRSL